MANRIYNSPLTVRIMRGTLIGATVLMLLPGLAFLAAPPSVMIGVALIVIWAALALAAGILLPRQIQSISRVGNMVTITTPRLIGSRSFAEPVGHIEGVPDVHSFVPGAADTGIHLRIAGRGDFRIDRKAKLIDYDALAELAGEGEG